MATKLKTRLVTQVPITGGKLPLIEKVFENFPMKIYTPQTANPMTKCQAIPPLIFLDAIENPIMVRIMIENGSAERLKRSTS